MKNANSLFYFFSHQEGKLLLLFLSEVITSFTPGSILNPIPKLSFMRFYLYFSNSIPYFCDRFNN